MSSLLPKKKKMTLAKLSTSAIIKKIIIEKIALSLKQKTNYRLGNLHIDDCKFKS